MDKNKQLKLQIVEEDIIEEESTELQVTPPTQLAPQTMTFDRMMEMAEMLSKSPIVPMEYRNRPESVFLALDMSNRMGVSVTSIMQGMNVINGKTSFSGSFIAGLVRSTPLFSDVKVNWVGEKGKDDFGCYISATDTRTGEKLKGATVDIRMVKLEQWDKNPKWKSLTEQMLMYRAFSFFGRVFASELLSGIFDVDEMNELRDRKSSKVVNPYENGE